MSEKEERTSYDILLEDNKNLHEELNALKSKISDFYDFSKSLLNSRAVSVSKEDNEEESKALLDKLKEDLKK